MKLRIFLFSTAVLCVALSFIFCCSPHQSTLPTADEVSDVAEQHNKATTTIATTAASTIDPQNFDANLLASLISDKINELRRAKTRCPLLRPNDILAAAANEQSRYVTQKGDLTHEQTGSANRNKHTVLDRVRLYGGSFTPVGENLLFQGFKRRVYDDGREIILYPSYDEMAKQMVRGWQNSKPHYANIIECDFNNSGVAVMYSAKKNGIFAAQVFGGN